MLAAISPLAINSLSLLNLKKDIALKYPTTPDESACNKVAPINLMAERYIASSSKKLGAREKSIRMFSTAAKPKADDIMYTIASTGSLSSGFFLEFCRIAMYFINSSEKATKSCTKKAITIDPTMYREAIESNL